ncbi:MAG: protein kinase domain-containing protein [bacterium]|jgi:Tol biopolymer transport system component/predicted Ser/Thr protein kinase
MDMVGRTISRYEIISRLGEGGMGVVYKARDTHLDRIVALKVLPGGKVSDPDRKRRFMQEARAASALNHAGIVTVYDIDEADDISFIAMEYVSGKTLDAVIPRKGMRLGEALRIAIEVADALARAHAAGIVHRDLKPGNVMVTDDGHAKVLDFGLAKLTEPPEGDGDKDELAHTVTAEGMIVGTAGYMAPEQAEGRPADARADIFSFGCLLYEMLTGERAFRGSSPGSTIASILRDEPKPPSSIVADLPSDVDKVIRRCLRKDPARRFQTMADLKVALQELKEDSESGQIAINAVPARPRRRAVWAIAAPVLVLAAASAWFALRRPAEQTEPMRIVNVTAFEGNETQPDLSPDGNVVAYVWSGPRQDNDDIYVQQIGSGDPIRRTTDPARDVQPSFSPDGQQIAFAREREGRGWDVFVMPAFSGGERKVCTVNAITCAPRWSPDGRYLTVTHRAGREDRNSIRLVSVETGEMWPLSGSAGDDRGLVDLAGQISPDGRYLLFTRGLRFTGADLYYLPLADGYKPAGEARRLTSDAAGLRGFTWLRDSRTVIFGSSRAGASTVWRLDARSGGAPLRLPGVGDGTAMPAAALRADRLAFVQERQDSNIWSVDLETGARAQAVSSTLNEWSPAFSPDGKRIAFISDRSGYPELWVADRDGSRSTQLTDSKTGVMSPRWSPDGRRIAYTALSGGRWQTFIIGADGGAPVAVNADQDRMIEGGWSADGRFLYASGRDGIWRVPAAEGKAVAISTDRGWGVVESADGRYVYYANTMRGYRPGEPTAVWRVPVSGGEASEVIPAVLSANHFTVTPRGVFYISEPEHGRYAIRMLEFATGRQKLIAELDRTPNAGVSVSPDGRTLLWSQVDAENSDVMLIENFR